MPHQGKGKARRILVVEADRWIDEGGPQRAAKAAKAAGQAAAQKAQTRSAATGREGGGAT
jgi:hypothetical protein